MNLKITKLTNSDLENISGGSTTNSAFARISIDCPIADAISGIFLILFGAIIFGVSVHNIR